MEGVAKIPLAVAREAGKGHLLRPVVRRPVSPPRCASSSYHTSVCLSRLKVDPMPRTGHWNAYQHHMPVVVE